MWRREGGRNSQDCMHKCTPILAQITSFSQGIVRSGQSQANETDFSQIGANPNDLGF